MCLVLSQTFGCGKEGESDGANGDSGTTAKV